MLPDGSSRRGCLHRRHGGSSTGHPDSDRLWAGTYYFSVPARLTTATLAVDPISVAGAEYQVSTGDKVTVSLPAYAIPVTLPPPAAPVAPTTPATILPLTASPATPRRVPPGAVAAADQRCGWRCFLPRPCWPASDWWWAGGAATPGAGGADRSPGRGSCGRDVRIASSTPAGSACTRPCRRGWSHPV